MPELFGSLSPVSSPPSPVSGQRQEISRPPKSGETVRPRLLASVPCGRALRLGTRGRRAYIIVGTGESGDWGMERGRVACCCLLCCDCWSCRMYCTECQRRRRPRRSVVLLSNLHVSRGCLVVNPHFIQFSFVFLSCTPLSCVFIAVAERFTY